MAHEYGSNANQAVRRWMEDRVVKPVTGATPGTTSRPTGMTWPACEDELHRMSWAAFLEKFTDTGRQMAVNCPNAF